MLKVISSILFAMSLSGCAVPLVMGANIAAAEAFSSAVNPEMQLDGAQLYRLASWDGRAERTTYSISGKSDWMCARRLNGGFICVPPDEATEANVSQKVFFACRTGQGGMVAQVIDSRNATTLFCEKIRS